jgi:AcrR family transcriptional regulator
MSLFKVNNWPPRQVGSGELIGLSQRNFGNYELTRSFRCIFAVPNMENKDRILTRAGALFLRNGIKSVSMDDIAADLGMSKKTLYKTFASKDAIVLAVMSGHLGQAQGECTRVASTAANAVEEMLNLSAWADKEFANVHPSIFYDLKKYHPESWALFATHKNAFILDQITANLRRGITEGLFRADLDVDVLARLNLAQIEMAFDPDRYPPAQFSPVRVNRVFDEHFLLGVATLKGHRLFNKYQHITEEE